MTSEKDLAQALKAGLLCQFKWGWAPLESALQPPSMPLVTLIRLGADIDSTADMCRANPDEIVGTITLETHVWCDGYEDARHLQNAVRAIVLPTGWNLTSEQDAYDSAFRAWRIAAQWTDVGPLFTP